MNAKVIFLEKWLCVTNLIFSIKIWLYNLCTQKCQITIWLNYTSNSLETSELFGSIWSSLQQAKACKSLRISTGVIIGLMSYYHMLYDVHNQILSCTSYMVYIFYMSANSLEYCLVVYRIIWDSTRWKGILFSGPLYR